jgi:hypothetical protein
VGENISTIIFSKNRACQLELLLRSLNMPAVVIYTYDPDFKRGYEKLIDIYPSVKFIRQTNLKEQIIQNLGDYTMFEVDDAVMIEHFSKDCPEFKEFKSNPDILCLSLRMSPNYSGAPIFKNNTWAWRGLRHSWGYPMSVSSHIFRRDDILPTILKSEMEIPNDLEVALRRNPPDRPLMLCFTKPKMITNEANNVQTKYPTPNFGVSVRELEDRFLKGERLSLEYIKEVAKQAKNCFIRVDYKWEKGT